MAVTFSLLLLKLVSTLDPGAKVERVPEMAIFFPVLKQLFPQVSDILTSSSLGDDGWNGLTSFHFQQT